METDSASELPSVPFIQRIELPSESVKTFRKKAIKRASYRNRIFNDLNAHSAEFTDCDFSYSIFHRGYFRDAKFKNCTFVGCQFYDCNFRGSNLYLCDVRYIRFHRCQLDAKSIISALPTEPNIRQDALKNLRANATEVGDFDSQRLLVLEEIKASKDHYRRAVLGAEDYYQKKYPSLPSKLAAGWKLLLLYMSGIVWGHGERPTKIIVSGLILLALLTLINLGSVIDNLTWSSFFGIVQYTTSVFFDLSPRTEFKGFLFIDYLLALLRYIYVGLYISVLYKTISHR